MEDWNETYMNPKIWDKNEDQVCDLFIEQVLVWRLSFNNFHRMNAKLN